MITIRAISRTGANVEFKVEKIVSIDGLELSEIEREEAIQEVLAEIRDIKCLLSEKKLLESTASGDT